MSSQYCATVEVVEDPSGPGFPDRPSDGIPTELLIGGVITGGALLMAINRGDD